MRQFIKIKCPACGEENDYLWGIGYLPLERSAYEEIQEKEEFAILKPLVKSPDDLYDSCYKLYWCKECKTLENHISFRLRNNTSFRLRRKCVRCGKVMKGMCDADAVLEKKITVTCGNCGKEDIAPSDGWYGCWD